MRIIFLVHLSSPETVRDIVLFLGTAEIATDKEEPQLHCCLAGGAARGEKYCDIKLIIHTTSVHSISIEAAAVVTPVLYS